MERGKRIMKSKAHFLPNLRIFTDQRTINAMQKIQGKLCLKLKIMYKDRKQCNLRDDSRELADL
jgi:hypothetical protein